MTVLRAGFLVFMCLAALSALSFEVRAQGGDYNRFLETLSDLNRIKPLQNHKYDPAADILERRILDRKHKVIGEVHDVILTRDGSIASLRVEFDRLHLGGEVFLNYPAMRLKPVSNGYALGFDGDQIENMYPELLANVETASGAGDENFSVQALSGAPVLSRDGRRLGKVETVLFGSRGQRAEALYIAVERGVPRTFSVAVPFRAVTYMFEGHRMKVMLDDVQAAALLGFVKEQS